MIRFLKFFSSVLLILIVVLNSISCNDSPYKQGKMYYDSYCGNCHMDNGEGLKGIIPPLSKADILTKNRQDLPCMIRKGIKGAITVNGVVYNQQDMPALPQLTEFEITNILNYIGTSWGNTEKLFTVEEVRDGLKKCE